ncbi:exodeoxyribonuclease V subunit gamma [Conexibacter sp. SYSU D00693]|uniref:exodeoxyribonuclease V subunit gamma n=1 Tax=Conexibacter sp. SYSU D00693 TaxID=2812560 RepID=UPI00196B309D|nr:exodeoxyribonuclease V subunit gamma [Conexibacter sp. SYSU D00693]
MLHVHRAERADALVDALRAVLADPPQDAFAAEVVAVPSKGVERWIAQRLSHALGTSAGREDGVCANVLFPSPRRVLDEAVAVAAGVDPEEDPWSPERAAWPLLEVVETHAGEPWLATLTAHLDRAQGRLATVRHLAGLFDRYALHRPELLRAWAARDDAAVPDAARWQPELWRRLRERLGVPSPSERLPGACARLEAEPDVVDLPDRLALLGLTRLPAARLPVLSALAAHRDVHLHLLHPSPALWDRLAAHPELAGPLTRRRDAQAAALPRHPLLRSWGQDARELQLVLAGAAAPTADHHHAPARAPASSADDAPATPTLFDLDPPPAPAAPTTLLHRLQQAIRDDVAPPERVEDRPLLDPADRSLQVHSCHGRGRQVEVLKDAVLHLLADDPTLEPRDVIVMCPDIEAYAPLVHATFGAGEVLADEEDDELAEDDDATATTAGPELRVRLADRALRQTNPVLGVVARLLELADSRLTASELLDLADREPVRRRFVLDDDDLARLEDWVATSGTRWGLDTEHRARFRLQKVAQGTWEAGLDRLLLGVAMTEEDDRLVGGVLPLDDVGSSDIDLAGRFAELLARVEDALRAFAGEHPLAHWVTALQDAADALAATAPRDAWQRQELAAILADVAEAAATPATPLTLHDVRALLADRLRGRPTRANFRTGHLTICTLVPMRAVPHRVVCLLGLDDEVFPRGGARDGDDLVLQDPHVGDHDGRLEDRQLLLDALMSAQDRLVVTFGGKDERTNVRRPPAVPVGELLDVVDRTVRAPDGTAAATHVVVEHPLQPFDPRAFAGDGEGPWSYDATMLDGARALIAERVAAPPFLDGPLQPVTGQVVELDDLVRFVERPIGFFLRRRLGVLLGRRDDEVDDALTVEADGLERWAAGQRLLEARLRGTDLETARTAERARGTLPPGGLGDRLLDDLSTDVEALLACARERVDLTTAPASVDVRATLPDGRLLGGTVPGVAGEVLRAVSFSRLGPRPRLAAWVRLLALTATDPERPWRAVTIGRASSDARRGARISVAEVPPLQPEPEERAAAAAAQLGVLVDLLDRGLREPVPLACRSSAAYAAERRTGKRPEQALVAARDAWESSWNRPGEDADPEHEQVFGGRAALVDVWLPKVRADERGEGWPVDEDHRFGAYARRLWSGLLLHERTEDL